MVVSSNNRSKLHIQIIVGEKSHTHTTFRRLTKGKAKMISTQLKTKTVHEVYTNQGKGLENADSMPRDFVQKKSIENVKSKLNRQTDSAIDSLRLMFYSDEYGESLKELSTDPFCAIFWTRKQQYYYSEISKKYGASISLDATGGLIRNQFLLSEISSKLERRINIPHVFLYLISVKTPNGNSVPLAFMLSAQQDYIKIRYFLDRFQQSFEKPIEAVMDDSAALLKSCAVSFAECCSLNEYVKKCFNVLNGISTDLPKTFDRLDLAHYVKSLHRYRVLKKMKPEVRQLYLCTFGYLMQCTNYNAIKSTAELMITLVNTPAFGEVNGKPLFSTQSQTKLVNLIRSHDIKFIANDIEESDDEEFDDKDEEKSNEITFFDEILKGVLERSSQMNAKKCSESMYYNPDLNKYFKRQLNRLPLWTPVMMTHFGTTNLLGVSNDTESRYNVIKNVIFNDVTLPIRPDIFIKRLLDYSDNLTTINRLEIKHKENVLSVSCFDMGFNISF